MGAKAARAKKKRNKFLLIPTICLLIVTALTLCGCIPVIWYLHDDTTIFDKFNLAALLLHGFQMTLLILILMLRLYSIFKNTAHKLSKCAIYVFIFLHGFGWILFFATFISSFWSDSLFLFFLNMASLIAYITNISLSLAFVYKLIRVNRSTHNARAGENKMLKTITKNTILAIVAVITSIINVVWFSMYETFADVSVYAYFAVLLDVYTNYLSIILQFSWFSLIYYQLCGCLDKLCQRLCVKRKDEGIGEMDSLQNLSAQSSATMPTESIANSEEK